MSAAPSSNGNGEFGDWNTFSANPPTSSGSGPSQPVTDLFGGVQSPTASNPAPVPPSAELFDLMGGVNHQLTNPHATLSASQSLTFSLGGATPTMPLSRSQQVEQVHITGKPHFSWKKMDNIIKWSILIVQWKCLRLWSKHSALLPNKSKCSKYGSNFL